MCLPALSTISINLNRSSIVSSVIRESRLILTSTQKEICTDEQRIPTLAFRKICQEIPYNVTEVFFDRNDYWASSSKSLFFIFSMPPRPDEAGDKRVF